MRRLPRGPEGRKARASIDPGVSWSPSLKNMAVINELIIEAGRPVQKSQNGETFTNSNCNGTKKILINMYQ